MRVFNLKSRVREVEEKLTRMIIKEIDRVGKRGWGEGETEGAGGEGGGDREGWMRR